jgi:hypothetical protein
MGVKWCIFIDLKNGSQIHLRFPLRRPLTFPSMSAIIAHLSQISTTTSTARLEAQPQIL